MKTPSETRVLVTGAAGFIGSHVAKHCHNAGYQVVANDDLSGGFLENVPPGCEFSNGDVSDGSYVKRLFTEHGPFDLVYHLAAYAAEGLSHFIRSFNYRNNLVASTNILNECINHNVRCCIFTSSIAVYGRNQLPMTEDLVPQPEDPYGIAKYAFELDLKAAHEMFGMDYIVFRPHNVYGEHQNIADRYRNVIGIFMNQVLQGKPMPVFGDGLQTRAFSYIDDVAPIIARSPNCPNALNKTFNIGADTPFTIIELGTEIAQAFDVKPDFTFLEARNEVQHAFADHSLLKRIFSPPDPIDLNTGINRMADWVKQHGPRPSTNFSGIEVYKNLPKSWST